jgi:hypothetical protein
MATTFPHLELFLGRDPLPEFVAALDGVGYPEDWGRWNRGTHIRLRLREALPREFDLVLRGAVTAANVGRPFTVSAGGCQRVFVLTHTLTDGIQQSTMRMKMTMSSRSLDIHVPGVEIAGNGDRRALGLALAYLAIVPSQPASRSEETAADCVD